jgi:hypothetical protein
MGHVPGPFISNDLSAMFVFLDDLWQYETLNDFNEPREPAFTL